MAQIIFITGGARSGKSAFAQKTALQFSNAPVYLATARIWDNDFRQRVERHRADRGREWTTIEEEIDIHKTNIKGKTVVVDCITLWLTNIFYKNEYNIEKSLQVAKTIWDSLTAKDVRLIVVSNEIGMSVHPENEMSRKFVDLQGFVNQHIAKTANSVFLMVSGIELKIK